MATGFNYTMATYENSENTATPNLSENAYYGSDWVWTNTLTFDKTFGQHKILAVGGYEAVKYGMGRSMNAQGRVTSQMQLITGLLQMVLQYLPPIHI